MRPDTWSLRSPFQRLTKTKELIPMDFPPEMEIAGFTHPLPCTPFPTRETSLFSPSYSLEKARMSQVLSTAQS